MFGDLSGMMGKLKETQKKIEETKVRLDSVLIDESYNDNRIKVTVTANGIIRGITIEPGNSALFLLVRDVTPDKVLERLEGFNPTVLQTSLSKEDEQKLREAFSAHDEE